MNMQSKTEREPGIQKTLYDYYKDSGDFTLQEAIGLVKTVSEKNVKVPSIRARIYEGIDKGLFKRIGRGVYRVEKDGATCLLIQGDGRDLSFLHDESVDCIITDHPWSDHKSIIKTRLEDCVEFSVCLDCIRGRCEEDQQRGEDYGESDSN